MTMLYRFIIIYLIFVLAPQCRAESDIKTPPFDEAERLLLTIFEMIEQQNRTAAEEYTQVLIKHYPHFKLGPLILDSIRDQQPIPATNPIPINPEQDENIPDNLHAEIYLRKSILQKKPQEGLLPFSVIKLSQHIKYLLLIDAELSRLYLIKNSETFLQLIADFYIGIGKQGMNKQYLNDHKTPTGVYRITKYLPGEKLPDLYGNGAYPINYPNTWDRRLQRTGSGIWIHGVPRSTYSRPPRSSRGCVTMSNILIDQLSPYIDLSITPVIMTTSTQWISESENYDIQHNILAALEQWENDWESLDTDIYLKHYHPEFIGGNKNLKSWSKHKRRVNKNKEFVKLEISNTSMYHYPGEENLILIHFTQQYTSDNLKSTRNKEQYWKKKDGRWLIISEKVIN